MKRGGKSSGGGAVGAGGRTAKGEVKGRKGARPKAKRRGKSTKGERNRESRPEEDGDAAGGQPQRRRQGAEGEDEEFLADEDDYEGLAGDEEDEDEDGELGADGREGSGPEVGGAERTEELETGDDAEVNGSTTADSANAIDGPLGGQEEGDFLAKTLDELLENLDQGKDGAGGSVSIDVDPEVFRNIVDPDVFRSLNEDDDTGAHHVHTAAHAQLNVDGDGTDDVCGGVAGGGGGGVDLDIDDVGSTGTGEESEGDLSGQELQEVLQTSLRRSGTWVSIDKHQGSASRHRLLFADDEPTDDSGFAAERGHGHTEVTELTEDQTHAHEGTVESNNIDNDANSADLSDGQAWRWPEHEPPQGGRGRSRRRSRGAGAPKARAARPELELKLDQMRSGQLATREGVDAEPEEDVARRSARLGSKEGRTGEYAQGRHVGRDAVGQERIRTGLGEMAKPIPTPTATGSNDAVVLRSAVPYGASRSEALVCGPVHGDRSAIAPAPATNLDAARPRSRSGIHGYEGEHHDFSDLFVVQQSTVPTVAAALRFRNGQRNGYIQPPRQGHDARRHHATDSPRQRLSPLASSHDYDESHGARHPSSPRPASSAYRTKSAGDSGATSKTRPSTGGLGFTRVSRPSNGQGPHGGLRSGEFQTKFGQRSLHIAMTEGADGNMYHTDQAREREQEQEQEQQRKYKTRCQQPPYSQSEVAPVHPAKKAAVAAARRAGARQVRTTPRVMASTDQPPAAGSSYPQIALRRL